MKCNLLTKKRYSIGIIEKFAPGISDFSTFQFWPKLPSMKYPSSTLLLSDALISLKADDTPKSDTTGGSVRGMSFARKTRRKIIS